MDVYRIAHIHSIYLVSDNDEPGNETQVDGMDMRIFCIHPFHCFFTNPPRKYNYAFPFFRNRSDIRQAQEINGDSNT